MTFTTDELLNAIRDAGAGPEATPDSITAPELARALGVSGDQARAMIKDAIAAGSMRPERVWRMTMTGSMQRVAGYVMVKRPN